MYLPILPIWQDGLDGCTPRTQNPGLPAGGRRVSFPSVVRHMCVPQDQGAAHRERRQIIIPLRTTELIPTITTTVHTGPVMQAKPHNRDTMLPIR